MVPTKKMTTKAPGETRILVAIASYGTNNDKYLAALVREYRSMLFDVSIVVLTDRSKETPAGVETLVGLPTRNPFSLPFAHKQIFAERLNEYDLFVYSEDDTLITERNLRAFLRVSAALPEDEIPGFVRYEAGSDEIISYPDIHGTFHWEPASLREREGFHLAFFTNEHSACYAATQGQLRRAIRSGGFLAGPREGKYGMLETAATDLYTQCGLKKLICISHLEDFVVHHLPNKYVGTFGIDHSELHEQLKALLRIEKQGPSVSPQLEPNSSRYPADYYESVRPEILSAIPKSAQSVLSIGCGRAATEARLAGEGVRVVAVPLDPVISAGAEARGVTIFSGTLETARRALAGQQFDCILISNVFSLAPDPVELLGSFSALLANEGTAIMVLPRIRRLRHAWRMLRRGDGVWSILKGGPGGIKFFSRHKIRSCFRTAGLRMQASIEVPPGGSAGGARRRSWISKLGETTEVIAVGRR